MSRVFICGPIEIVPQYQYISRKYTYLTLTLYSFNEVLNLENKPDISNFSSDAMLDEPSEPIDYRRTFTSI